jgi:hypothetical protein
MLFACVGLDWARPQVPLPPDRIDQMVLRQRAHAPIGVRAAGKTKPTSNKEEEALKKHFNLDQQTL